MSITTVDYGDAPVFMAVTPFATMRACPICECTEHTIIQTLRDFQFFTDAVAPARPKRMTLHDVQCTNCGTLYKNPTYTEEGYRYLFSETGRSYGNGTFAQAQVEWLRDRGLLAGRKSVLDVGCGSGRFLSLMPQTWQRVGVEPDDSMAAVALAAGAPSIAPEVAALRASFDLITLWHVLEHVPDPIATLQALRAIAHAETRLVVEVPVLEAGATPDVTGFLSPHHTTHFSIRTLGICLGRAGWAPLIYQPIAEYNGYRIVSAPSTATQNDEWRLGPNDDSALIAYLSAQRAHRREVQKRLWNTAADVVIWGAGLHVESLYQWTQLFHLRRSFVLVDSDPAKQGKTWRGIAISRPADVLPAVEWSVTQLLVSSFGDQAAIVEAARAWHVPADRIVTLYDNPASY